MHHFLCCYCEHNGFDTVEKSAFHKVRRDHGPFTIYKCIGCDSLITFPLPTSAQLHSLYNSFENGVNPRLNELRQQTPLTEWYKQCVDEATRSLKPVINWLDAGSGGGELAELLSKKLPGANGVVVDFAPQLSNSPGNIRSVTADMNKDDWMLSLPHSGFDLIVCVAVLEHVLYPDKFLDQLIALLNKDGRLYLISPDNASWAARFFRRRWPFYIPGEHLHIATPRGISKWFQRVQQRSSNSFKARVSSCKITYPIRYILGFLRLGAFGKLFSPKTNVRVNAGLLRLVIERRK